MHNIFDLNLIGKNIVIKNSTDPLKINLTGKVIFETKNIVVLVTKNKIVKIKKNEIINLEKDM